jgi:MFS family permease
MSPPPNGGAMAWLQVVGSWMLFFNTWGILNTFGVYQTYYESGALFNTSSSNISWVGSIQAFLVLMVGCVSGPIYDRGHFRYLLIAGTFFVVFGHMMLSLCHEFWQVILAQGFTVGIGAGLLFVPAIAIMPTYFSSRIGLAIGLAASGSSMGGIIYPITFFRLIDQIGFGWSVRVLGFMALATLMVPLAVMKMRFKPAKARALVDWAAFTDVPYMTFVFGAMIGYIGLYVTFFYISFYGQQQRITNESMSFYLVPILNAGSVFGRTLPNWLSDYTGPLNTVVPGMFSILNFENVYMLHDTDHCLGALITGALILCLMAVKSSAALIVEAVLLGFFSGIYIALPPVIFVQLTPDKSKIGTRIGMGFALLGAGVLAGGPGGGGILQRHGDGPNDPLDWHGTWIYGGVCTIASAAIMSVVRVMKAGVKVKKV